MRNNNSVTGYLTPDLPNSPDELLAWIGPDELSDYAHGQDSRADALYQINLWTKDFIVQMRMMDAVLRKAADERLRHQEDTFKNSRLLGCRADSAMLGERQWMHSEDQFLQYATDLHQKSIQRTVGGHLVHTFHFLELTFGKIRRDVLRHPTNKRGRLFSKHPNKKKPEKIDEKPDQSIDDHLAAIRADTRVPTGLVLPVDAFAASFKESGRHVFVHGGHGYSDGSFNSVVSRFSIESALEAVLESLEEFIKHLFSDGDFFSQYPNGPRNDAPFIASK
jgi:hypothetical protein